MNFNSNSKSTDSVLKLQPGEKLRFATLGEDATGKVQFVANEVKEKELIM